MTVFFETQIQIEIRRAVDTFNLISRISNENAMIQGIGGIIGSATTIAADIYALKIYSSMWDEIRAIYGYQPISIERVKDIIPKLGQEIIADIIVDKVLGYVPVVGIATNIMCAKAMTWRLGVLFAMLSARGSTMTDNSIIKSVRLIREIYPQRNMFSFTAPSKESVVKIIISVANNTAEEFEQKVEKALEVFN